MVLSFKRNVLIIAILGQLIIPLFAIATVTPKIVGGSSAFALKSDGTVWGWGDNSYGQLGNGTTEGSSIPKEVPGLTGVVDIASSGPSVFAVKSDGTVWVWGNNENGELGDGTKTQRWIPKKISGISGAIAIASSGSTTFVLKSDGTVWGWGDNTTGQLGTGNTIYQLLPKKLDGMTDVKQIVCEGSYTLVLKKDGTVWGCGSNTTGSLGDGTKISKNTLVQAAGLSDIVSMSSYGLKSLALKNDGTVWTWGSGQLTPVQIAGLDHIIGISVGAYNFLALRNDGTVLGWGANFLGSVGDGTIEPQNTPVVIPNLEEVVSVWAYGGSSAAITKNSAVYTWGANNFGQLGQGVTTYRNIPARIPIEYGIKDIASGNIYTIAATNEGKVLVWGLNRNGQLGLQDVPLSSTPVDLIGIDNVIAVAASSSSSLALKSDGTLWTWGGIDRKNPDGTTILPYEVVQVPEISGIIAISGGGDHFVALKDDGTVWTWGDNGYGQLGDGTQTDRSQPIKVVGLTDISTVSAGAISTLALRKDGTVWAWGAANYLFGGIIPHQVGLSDIVSISEAWQCSLALKADGSIWAWGSCQETFGNGQWNMPTSVANIFGAVSVVGGNASAYVVKSDGSLLAIGRNHEGQLGNGSYDRSAVFTKISGVEGVKSAYSKYYTAFAVTDGEIGYAWGDDSFGQVGDSKRSLFPKEIVQFNVGTDSVTRTVTPSVDGNGSIFPDVPQDIPYGSYATFTITPASGYQISSVTGCDGILSGSTYTTGAITDACTVSAAFTITNTPAPIISSVKIATISAPPWSSATHTIMGSTPLKLTVSATGGAVKYQYSIDNGAPLPAIPSSSRTLIVPANSMAEGAHSITVQASNAAGNTGYYGPITVIVDNTAPTAEVTGQPTALTKATIVKLAVAGDQFIKYRFKKCFTAVNSPVGACSAWSPEKPITAEISIPARKSGYYEVAVIGRDAAGVTSRTNLGESSRPILDETGEFVPGC